MGTLGLGCKARGIFLFRLFFHFHCFGVSRLFKETLAKEAVQIATDNKEQTRADEGKDAAGDVGIHQVEYNNATNGDHQEGNARVAVKC